MAIDGVNTAMSPLQFASARSLSRAVETADHARTRTSGGMSASPMVPAAIILGQAPAKPPRLIAPASFHCTYRPLPGKPAAKRQPQLADSAYWSCSINRLG